MRGALVIDVVATVFDFAVDVAVGVVDDIDRRMSLPVERASYAGRSLDAAGASFDTSPETERSSVGEVEDSRAATERDTRSPIVESDGLVDKLSDVSPNVVLARPPRAASSLAVTGTGSPVRRASRSVKFWAASAPGPVRGATGDVNAFHADDEIVDDRDDDDDDLDDALDAPLVVCCRRATARASDPTNGDEALPPGATTKAERRMGEADSRSRSTLGERRAPSVAVWRRNSGRSAVDVEASSRRRATSPGREPSDATEVRGVELRVRRAVVADSTSML